MNVICYVNLMILIVQSQSDLVTAVIFTELLSEPLGIGSRVIFTGTPSEDLPGFALNIGCGESGCEDIAVHFNPRLSEGRVARNTYLHGQWGPEEIYSNRPFPFQAGRPFTIEVVIKETETLWTVNGELYCRYAHRTPSPLLATRVQTTFIRDATLKVQSMRNVSPTLKPNLATAVKFTQLLSKPLGIGSSIIFTGTPSEDLPGFALNIGCGEPGCEDIAVHFNPRLPEGRVARNTYLHGQWGPEEIYSNRPFPFQAGRPFTIEVVIQETETLWTVNGELYCRYAHRTPSPLFAKWVQTTFIRDVTLKVQNMPNVSPTLKPNLATAVKFTQLLSEPLGIGSSIIFTGTPSEDLPGFALNIGCGEPGSGDIAVHFNPRLSEGRVARNTYLHGQWGAEELHSDRPFPFQAGHPFTIEVVIKETETLWTVNGELYCRYAHRTPSPLFAKWVQTTFIRDATLKVQNMPNVSPTSKPNLATAVKFTQLLSEPLGIGSSIIFTGTPSEDLPGFALNIGCGEPGCEDIAVHFNPRLSEGRVARNSYLHGQWGPEEIYSNRPFPFQAGRPFTIEVVIKETETLWTVNGELYCRYAHRTPNPLFTKWVQTTFIRDATLKVRNTQNVSLTYPRRN